MGPDLNGMIHQQWITAGIGVAFVGESSPVGRDDGDDGQGQSHDRQRLGDGRNSEIARLHRHLHRRSRPNLVWICCRFRADCGLSRFH